MSRSVLDCSPSYAVVVDYDLLPTLNSPQAGGEDEPIAVCTVRLGRSDTLREERPLAAWHFPQRGHPIPMPIGETGESTDQVYAGRFLLLPRRDLTLALVDVQGQERSFVQLCLAPADDRPCDGEVGMAAWHVCVVWSDGVEVAMRKVGCSPLIGRVGDLFLSETQCRTFVRLGGQLHLSSRVDAASVTIHDLTWVGDEGGQPGFALSTRTVPQQGEQTSTCSISASFRTAVGLGRLNLLDCWLLLPVVCQGCLQPVVGEVTSVETLWGKMHPDCAVAKPLQIAEGGLVVREEVRRPSVTSPYQLAFPGMDR